MAYGSDTKVIATINLAWLEWFIGHTEKANKLSKEAIVIADEVDLPLSKSYALGYVCCNSPGIRQLLNYKKACF